MTSNLDSKALKAAFDQQIEEWKSQGLIDVDADVNVKADGPGRFVAQLPHPLSAGYVPPKNYSDGPIKDMGRPFRDCPNGSEARYSAIKILYAGRSTFLEGDEPHRAEIERVMGRRFR